jgi:hypothetical protein
MSDSELEDLRQWKKSALTVFNSYDAQKLAKLLRMPLGVDIMPNLQRAIEKVLARVADLESKAHKLDKELAYEHGQHHLTHGRATKAEARVAELEAYIKKTQPTMDFYLDGCARAEKISEAHINRAESAELALRKIKEAYEARSELFTSDAECAQNMADWATLALKKREKP